MALFQFFVSGAAVFLAVWLVCASGISSLMNKVSGGLAGGNAFATNLLYGDETGVSASLYNLTPLMHKQRQVILIGASNVRAGFSARQIKKDLSGIPVHNLASSGGSPKNYTEEARLSFDAIPKKSWNNTTFVLGIIMETFVKPYKDTKVQTFNTTAAFRNAGTRYGLYSFTNGSFGIQPNVPRFLLKPALVGLLPVSTFEGVWKYATEVAQYCVDKYNGKYSPSVTEKDTYKTAIIAQNQKLKTIQDSIDLGSVSQERFRELYNLADFIHRHGGNLVLVDLPLPKWYSSAVPAFADYQKRKMKWLHLLQRKYNVAYINMQDGFSDSTFIDHVHPKRDVVPLWSMILAKKLHPILVSEKRSPVAAN